MKAKPDKKKRASAEFFSPVLAPLILNRPTMALLTGLTFLLTALTAMGLTAWPCPIQWALGIEGPGCGLTRAMVLLVQGHWQAAVHLHAFAPIVLGVGILVAAASALPAGLRHAVARKLATFEKRTAIVALLIGSMLIYWILRIMISV